MLSTNTLKNSAPIDLVTTNDFYPEGGDFEYLCRVSTYVKAFYHCRKNSLWKSSTQRFEKDILACCLKIAETVKQGKYYPKTYQEFNLFERGKPRHIKAPLIEDRVFVHALVQDILLPRIRPHLIYDNSAALKQRGISFARKRLLAHLHRYYKETGSNKGYILQTDFSKFFDSINHDLLCKQLCKYTTDTRVQTIIRRIVDSFGEAGLGIGSELSQTAGILFPSKIDNYCKIVKSCKYYARYMDDIYVIHQSKVFLQELFKELQAIANELKLKFNPKKCHINRLDKVFTYLKSIYHFTITGAVICRPSKSCLRRERLKLKHFVRLLNYKKLTLSDIQNTYKSWRGNIIRQYPKTARAIVRVFDKQFTNLFGELV